MRQVFRKTFGLVNAVALLSASAAVAGPLSRAHQQRSWNVAELTNFDPMPVIHLAKDQASQISEEAEVAADGVAIKKVEMRLSDVIRMDSISIGNFIEGKVPALRQISDSDATRTSQIAATKRDGVAVVDFIESSRVSKSETTSVLHVNVASDKVKFSPAKISSDAVGSHWNLKFSYPKEIAAESLRQNMKVFVRDQSIAELDPGLTKIQFKSAGATEAYFIIKDKLFIVPINIGGSESSGPFIKVPSELVSLDGFIAANTARSAAIGFAPPQQASTGSVQEDEEFVQATAEVSSETLVSDELRGPSTNLTASRSTGLLTHALKSNGRDGRYRDVTVQIVDDRSAPELNRLYPVPNADVRIIGVGSIGKTDARGAIVIQDVPRGARLVIAIEHEEGLIHPQLAEVSTESNLIQRVTVLRESYFDLVSRSAGTSQLSFKGSSCVTVRDLRKQGQPPLEGVGVGIDLEAEGPYYSNQFGLPDARRQYTGPDGRACFFNIQPGVATLSVSYRGNVVAAGVSNFVANKHKEDQFAVFGSGKLHLSIASITSSHEQLGSDGELTNNFRPVDFINMSLAGESEHFASMDNGRLRYEGDMNLVNGRGLLFGQDGDFELTSYQIDASSWQGTNVIPLVPRGFVEDMAVYADVPFDPSLGSILAYQFAVPAGAYLRFRAISLEDESREFEGWVFAQGTTAKAMFFNVEPGSYAIVAETADGRWLNYQKATVYSETLSFVGNLDAISSLRPLGR